MKRATGADELCSVLERPDRGRIRVNALVHRTGGLVKRQAGRLIAAVRRSAE